MFLLYGDHPKDLLNANPRRSVLNACRLYSETEQEESSWWTPIKEQTITLLKSNGCIWMRGGEIEWLNPRPAETPRPWLEIVDRDFHDSSRRIPRFQVSETNDFQGTIHHPLNGMDRFCYSRLPTDLQSHCTKCKGVLACEYTRLLSLTTCLAFRKREHPRFTAQNSILLMEICPESGHECWLVSLAKRQTGREQRDGAVFAGLAWSGIIDVR